MIWNFGGRMPLLLFAANILNRWLQVVGGLCTMGTKLATLPLELIEKIPNCREAPERLITNYQPNVYDLVVPLDQFITYASSVLIRNGSNEGCCNDDALRLSMDLVAAENWLMAQKVGVDSQPKNCLMNMSAIALIASMANH
jgi:hypothetical protein